MQAVEITSQLSVRVKSEKIKETKYQMNHWLFEKISADDGNRKPSFSVRGIDNWFRALRFEIENTHGKTVQQQIESCRDFYSGDKSIKANPNTANGKMFEQLFFSVIYSMTVDRFSSQLSTAPWIRPTAIVDWYYAVYFSIRAILPIFGHQISEDHAKTAKFVASTFRTHLPYPFDMLARRTTGEEYDTYIGGAQPQHHDLNRSFFPMSSIAQGMLAQYLGGTAEWYSTRTKNNILSDKKLRIKNFRTILARAERDRRLTDEIGFLHCAYRQRTKANYRDAIYLAYHYGEEIGLETFATNLSASAKFASINAIACTEHYIGRNDVKSFIEDLSVNLRGIDIAKPSEKYWAEFF